MGTTIRPLRAEDRTALESFPLRVSPETARTRFHGPMKMLTPATLDLLLGLEPGCREAVVAVDERGIAGVARFARDACGDPASGIAEIAIIVADDRQRSGLGRDLMLALAGLARAAGIATFRATMQEDNDGARRFVGRLAPGTPERFVRNTVVAELPVAALVSERD
ncbi:GNAT family N-acetyltransferase [Tsukamurella sputi]|uniref:GNAT family N-acetyltransferase n=1 Tax=Tsukamurella sputi TaxID=2591848 RepID=A0A5C5RQ66_9ACTN|nr:GNAT family N-acetyltransferase [Tsukamurella sputi]TWS24235.1 GNAT family N-acetyltransferase [Tsukamurella sputi]